MSNTEIDSRLPLLQDADLVDKVVLIRVDHNVVKSGAIEDPYRIDASLGTLYNVVERGGRPILMTHVGRPKDKTGRITTGPKSAVDPIVDYLERKLHTRFVVPSLTADSDRGIQNIDDSLQALVKDLRARRIAGIYLPNTRWFEGEEAKDDSRPRLARQLADLADVYVNDAFGSWQPHASTFDVARHLPGYAGYLMQKELINLKRVLEPNRPFLAVVAGSKYDTKIGPLSEIYKKVDHLILGGVIYNTYLCAKYDIRVAGVGDSDIEAARALVKLDQGVNKVVELPVLIESDTLEGRKEGQYRPRRIADFKPGDQYGYFLDVAPESFDDQRAKDIIAGARTIFVNAVMGFCPHFTEGTAKLDQVISQNRQAQKLLGGGDTLQEFKNLTPGLYLDALDNPQYYFFTGGGTVLKAIEEGSPYGLPTVEALMENKAKRA